MKILILLFLSAPMWGVTANTNDMAHHYAFEKQWDKLDQCLDKGYDVKRKLETDEISLFHSALMSNKFDLALKLIDKGINTKEIGGTEFVKDYSQKIDTQFGYLGATMKFPATPLSVLILRILADGVPLTDKMKKVISLLEEESELFYYAHIIGVLSKHEPVYTYRQQETLSEISEVLNK